ncbi:MAG TPA: phosphoribosylglycinamide formyltransferase [Arenimonas sp.]|nr:phosphoribosylglycinamide formyltransferase [Arenimonas sp.]
MLRLAVLASGRGSNLQAIIDAIAGGELDARIVGVFSDRVSASALARARGAGLHAQPVRPRDYADREAHDRALFDAIEAVQPDLIVCAGYMRLITDDAVRRFEGRMINIHPSLLPKYRGLDTHARALAAGEAEHGASVHAVVPALDAGPVLAQAVVDILPGDTAETLANRVLEREHALLIASLQLIAAGRVRFATEHVELDGQRLTAPLRLGDEHARLAA